MVRPKIRPTTCRSLIRRPTTVTYLKSTPRDANTPSGAFTMTGKFQSLPSPYWGERMIWSSQTSVHNPMIDQDGRLWMTSRIRQPPTPAFCRKGSDHPSAKLFPINESGRHVAMYDPRPGSSRYIDTCFTTHHLVFAEDADNTLWFSARRRAGHIGWLDTQKFLATGDEATSQGWAPFILDTNGNGKRDEWLRRAQPAGRSDQRQAHHAGLYGIG